MISILIATSQIVSASPDAVPHSIKCLIMEAVTHFKDVKSSEDWSNSWNAWSGKCLTCGCSRDTVRSSRVHCNSQSINSEGVWTIQNLEMRENDSLCWARVEVSFSIDPNYTRKMFLNQFSFVPRGDSAGWLIGKEYSIIRFSSPSDPYVATGEIGGSKARLTFRSEGTYGCKK